MKAFLKREWQRASELIWFIWESLFIDSINSEDYTFFGKYFMSCIMLFVSVLMSLVLIIMMPLILIIFKDEQKLQD